MEEIKLGDVTVNVMAEDDDVRVRSNGENILLSDESVRNIIGIITSNFVTIKTYYQSRIPDDRKNEFQASDLNRISVSILLHYLYVYNSWRRRYNKQRKIDLLFKDKDFDQPSTHDIIFNYFRKKYPDDWEGKCSMLLNLKLDDLQDYFKNRQAFYNK